MDDTSVLRTTNYHSIENSYGVVCTVVFKALGQSDNYNLRLNGNVI